MFLLLKNFLKVFKSLSWIISFFVWLILMLIPTYFFTWKGRAQIRLWMWDNYFYFLFVADVLLAILFWIFLASTIYKIKYFWKPKTSKVWILWAFIWSLVWWCASCSITFASILWFWAIVSALPYGWVELKILSFFLLIWAIFSTLKNLEICKLKKNN